MSLDFCAVDFETANRYRHSACQVGMARVVDGTIIESWSTMIAPPADELGFEEMCTTVHGIDASMVSDAPGFAAVAPEIVAFADGLPLLAHNASFDSAVMSRTAEKVGVRLPQIRFGCTLAMARAIVPGLPSYRLGPLYSELSGIETQSLHHAEADAVLCASSAVHLVRRSGAYDVADLVLLSRAGWRQIGEVL